MKKMVKAIGLASALLVSGAANADYHANWLIGASAAYGTQSGDINYSLSSVVSEDVASSSTGFSDSGWLWGLLVGYQAMCNCWLFGGELSVDWSNHDGYKDYAFSDSDEGINVRAKYDQDAIVALSARLGYEVSSFFLPYIRLGLETSRDKLEFESQTDSLAANGSESRRVWRFLGGVGLEMPVPMCAGLSVRGEYNYHSKGRTVTAGSTASDGVTYATAHTKQHANTGKLSLVWNFPA